MIDGSAPLLDPDFTDFGGDCFEWGSTDTSFFNLLNTQTNDPYHKLGPSSPAQFSTPSTRQLSGLQPYLPTPDLSFQTTPSSTVRSLTRRPGKQTEAQGTVNLILRTLKSYPLMMLRPDNLPPFIHPSLVSFDEEATSMEPLNNCMSLLHMISSGVPGSRKLFWKNVRLECERLTEEVGQAFSKIVILDRGQS